MPTHYNQDQVDEIARLLREGKISDADARAALSSLGITTAIQQDTALRTPPAGSREGDLIATGGIFQIDGDDVYVKSVGGGQLTGTFQSGPNTGMEAFYTYEYLKGQGFDVEEDDSAGRDGGGGDGGGGEPGGGFDGSPDPGPTGGAVGIGSTVTIGGATITVNQINNFTGTVAGPNAKGGFAQFTFTDLNNNGYIAPDFAGPGDSFAGPAGAPPAAGSRDAAGRQFGGTQPGGPGSALNPKIPGPINQRVYNTEAEPTSSFEEELDLSSTRQGRGTLFNQRQAGLGLQPSYIRNLQDRNFADYTTSFELGRGLGDLSDDDSFLNYLPENLSDRLGQGFYRDQVGDFRDLLLGGEDPDRDRDAFRLSSLGDRGLQFDAGFGSSLRGTPRELQGGASRVAGRRFGRAFDLDQFADVLGDPGVKNPFADFVDRGSSFNPDTSNFTSQLERISGLFGRDDLGAESQGYIDELRLDPEEQYRMALQSRIGDIPAALRGGFERTARQRFDRYRGDNLGSADQSFLQHFFDQGGRFR